jgi:hypothetical protein
MRQKRLHRDGLRRLYEGTSDFVPALLLPVIAVIDVIHPAQARNHPIVEILFPSSAQIQFHSLPEEARLPPHPSISPELGHPWIFWILGFFFSLMETASGQSSDTQTDTGRTKESSIGSFGIIDLPLPDNACRSDIITRCHPILEREDKKNRIGQNTAQSWPFRNNILHFPISCISIRGVACTEEPLTSEVTR